MRRSDAQRRWEQPKLLRRPEIALSAVRIVVGLPSCPVDNHKARQSCQAFAKGHVVPLQQDWGAHVRAVLDVL
eukprot:11117938-Alexandrium_andersonii.AAC.1